jgi:hypothetical protein
MEAVGTSETLINFYHTTRRHVPEDGIFDIMGLENLISVVLIVSNVGLLRVMVNGETKQMSIIITVIICTVLIRQRFGCHTVIC